MPRHGASGANRQRKGGGGGRKTTDGKSGGKGKDKKEKGKGGGRKGGKKDKGIRMNKGPKEALPRLHIDAVMISHLKSVMSEYTHAKKLLEAEDIEGGDDFELDSGDESGDSNDDDDVSDDDDDDSNSGESADEVGHSGQAEVRAFRLAPPSSQALQFLEGCGMPLHRAYEELRKMRGNGLREGLDVLQTFSCLADGIPRTQSSDALKTFGRSVADMRSCRNEEQFVLESMFGDRFEAAMDTWRITIESDLQSVLIPSAESRPFPYSIEIHFGEDCFYPFSAPSAVIFRDKTNRLPMNTRLYLTLKLQSLARGFVGDASIYSLYEWIISDDVGKFLKSLPASYIQLGQEIPLETAAIPKSESRRTKTSQPVARTSGPLPRYSDLRKNVGVAIVLKEDQSTGRTVNGFVEEVLTAGDHPRGVKVRLRDGKVGRVKFLTGLTFNSTQAVLSEVSPKASSSELASAMKTVSISGRVVSMSKAPASRRNSSVDRNVTVVAKAPAARRPIKTPAQIQKIERDSANLLQNFQRQQKSPAYIEMQKQRQELPAFTMKAAIISTIKGNRVTVVSGATGCGKSTQVPQFILDDSIMHLKGGSCNILVTQPRRIAAIGLADRVAAERAERVGESVGYQIRLESKVSDATRLTFCTTGILLRMLEDGAKMDGGGVEGISHIFVDEIHERSLDSDFLLMVLRDMLAIRTDLRLVLMSATLNAELFSSYFGGAPIIHIPGRTFPVQVLFLEDALARTNYRPEGPDYVRKLGGGRRDVGRRPPAEQTSLSPFEDKNVMDEELDFTAVKLRYPSLSDDAARSLLMMDTTKIHYPLIEMLVNWMLDQIFQLHTPPNRGNFGRGRGRGAPMPVGSQSGGRPLEPQKNRCILIFMPGYAEISTLHDLLSANAKIRQLTGNSQFLLALHSTLSSEEQVRVFKRPPQGTAKVIISTNVAETSVTVDDVVFVIDAGRMKETRFDPSKGMSSLEECWVSKANATQRRGRAGRVQSGTAVHLFTSYKFETFLDQQPPEIHRSPLEQICLRIKILPFLRGRIDQILSKVIEPPSEDAIRAAVLTLRNLQALSREEDLTPLGFHLGRLPVDVRIGKLILFGSIFRVLDPILTIASAMSIKSPFVAPFEKRDLADERKMAFSTGISDHLTLLTAYNEWQRRRRDGAGAEYRFLFDNFLSGKTLAMIASVKRQLAELLCDIGFVNGNVRTRDMERRGGRFSDGVAEAIGESIDVAPNFELIKALLVSALYPNVVKIALPANGKPVRSPQDLKMFVKGNEEVFIHPSSVNWKVAHYPPMQPFLIYHEKIKTTKVYIRDSSHISNFAIAFFGGRLKWDRKQNQLNVDDGWIRFAATTKTSSIIEASRLALDDLLQMKIENPGLLVSETNLVKAIVSLITTSKR